MVALFPQVGRVTAIVVNTIRCQEKATDWVQKARLPLVLEPELHPGAPGGLAIAARKTKPCSLTPRSWKGAADDRLSPSTWWQEMSLHSCLNHKNIISGAYTLSESRN